MLTSGDKQVSIRYAQTARILEKHSGEILADYLRRLRAMESPLVEAHSGGQLEAQALYILEDVARALRGEETATEQAEQRISEDLGVSRARSNIHPSHSLRAATALSRAALHAVVDNLPPSEAPGTEVAEVSLALQEGIVKSAARAGISYIDYLLRKVYEVQAEERRRISRELHDRVAHSLAVVCKNLELYEALKTIDPARAEEKISLAQRMAEDALKSGNQICTELRISEIRDGLETALSDFLRTNVPSNIRSWVSIKGNEALIPNHVREELFLVLREAIRNALKHSNARVIKVGIVTTPSLVKASVEDNGRGFVPGDAGTSSGGIGLKSMEERVALLRGALHLRSVVGEHTRVEVEVPLARR